jgi:rhodanese-related sulfurtransferase
MTVEELKEMADRGEAPVVIDVREAHELAIASFPMPVLHIPLGTLPARVAEIPAGARVVCACRSGGRSAQAAQFLRQRGVDAVNLEGGILAWSRRIDPSVRQY